MAKSTAVCEPIFPPDGFSFPDDRTPADTIRELLPSLVGPAGSKPVRRILRERTRRIQHLKASLFGEPAWDMLLELYASEIEQRRISVTSLCLASGVPATTALRWISALEREGLIQKRSDPLDGRRAYVSLSTKGLNAMFAYFRAAAFESVPSDSRLECCCQHCRARCRAEPK